MGGEVEAPAERILDRCRLLAPDAADDPGMAE